MSFHFPPTPPCTDCGPGRSRFGGVWEGEVPLVGGSGVAKDLEGSRVQRCRFKTVSNRVLKFCLETVSNRVLKLCLETVSNRVLKPCLGTVSNRIFQNVS